MNTFGFRCSMVIYRFLLQLYPAGYRREYSKAMQQCFRDQYRESMQKKKAHPIAALWLATCRDLLLSLLREHYAAWKEASPMQRKTLLAIGIGLVMAACIAYVDLTASEVQAPVALLLMFGGLAGLMQPKHAWRWALLLGLTIVLAEIGAFLVGYDVPGYIHARQLHPELPPHATLEKSYQFLIAFIPAFIGVYSGVLARKVLGIRNQPNMQA